MTEPLARFEITSAQIEHVVGAFYTRVRAHHLLGPVFATHVTDWAEHEAKIARFWKGAILHQPGYEGSPMMAHRRAGNVFAGHFPVWLGLFDDTLRRELDPLAAAGWSALAHRIGAGLRMGVADVGKAPADAPVLR
ncbi:globin family protein [Thioclava sp. SK-1]|uniref:group III truncated hemoglobin n=1 Tax=Thioclava sp. SK-1 TaxID=1889770 RepID=UPI0008271722|nr:group III truncated hemoglobin [Thioclava sp. SK-1]OCX64647.1 globin family protein [Thioclava sp. SK-1]